MRVSVLMTVHNGIENYPPGTLHRAVISTLGSDCDCELVVCDDGSTDETLDTLFAIAGEYDGPNDLVIIWHDERKGAAAGYQSAAEIALGRYAILQSCRSWYESGALKMMADYLDAFSNVGFVYGQTRYHGNNPRTYTPPPFLESRFYHHFDSLFGYMYRAEALEVCQYESYFEREGRSIDICDYDFVMQLIEWVGYRGYALRDQPVLNYYYSGEGQMTNLVHKYQHEINEEFANRWPLP